MLRINTLLIHNIIIYIHTYIHYTFFLWFFHTYIHTYIHNFISGGILSNSSLSFTSKDSYRLWTEIKRIFPYDAVTAIFVRFRFLYQRRLLLYRSAISTHSISSEITRESHCRYIHTYIHTYIFSIYTYIHTKYTYVHT